jgi:hypothetical protein
MNNNSQHKEQMLYHYDQWQQSGLNQIEYARQHQLKIHTFKYWIQKFNKQQSKSSGFIAIEPFVPTEINIRYPNGVELALPPQTSLKIISELIQFGKACSL